MTEQQIQAFNAVSTVSVASFYWLITLIIGFLIIFGCAGFVLYLMWEHGKGDVKFVDFILGIVGVLLVLSLYFGFLLIKYN